MRHKVKLDFAFKRLCFIHAGYFKGTVICGGSPLPVSGVCSVPVALTELRGGHPNGEDLRGDGRQAEVLLLQHALLQLGGAQLGAVISLQPDRLLRHQVHAHLQRCRWGGDRPTSGTHTPPEAPLGRRQADIRYTHISRGAAGEETGRHQVHAHLQRRRWGGDRPTSGTHTSPEAPLGRRQADIRYTHISRGATGEETGRHQVHTHLQRRHWGGDRPMAASAVSRHTGKA